MDDAPRLGGAQRTPSLLRCGLKHRAVVGKMLEGDASYVHSAVSPDIETPTMWVQLKIGAAARI